MAVQLTGGQTIDERYVLRGQLGRGGMAVVYEAYDPKLDMPVVLKILPRQLAVDPSFVVRFRREGRTLARLTHPHIVRLYEIGENEPDGLYYLVLEYLRGGTLKARQGRAPWTLERVVEVLRPVALALDHAHQQDSPVVHRDLKPANIMFGDLDRVVVSDFGLARMLAPEAALPLASDATWGSITAGAVLGTPAYMAPEQAEGYPAAEAADRYSLGIVAYELLVGVVPFLADTPQATLIQIVTKPLPLPSHINTAIEPALERVLLKALAKNPALRFDSAIELVESLDAASRRQSMPPPYAGWRAAARDPVGRSQPTRIESRPTIIARRSSTGFLAAGGFLVATAVVVGAMLFSQSVGERDVPEPAPPPTTVALGVAVQQLVPTLQLAQPAAAPTQAATSTATAAPVATAAPRATATPDTDQIWHTVLAELDTSWGQDWPRSVSLLEGFLARVPDHTDGRDKLYAALVLFGQQLTADGPSDDGVARLERAEALLPTRTEAQAALLALTPLPTPTPPVVVPLRTPVRQAIPPVRPAPPAAPQPTPTKPSFVPAGASQPPPTKPPFSPPGAP